MRKKTLLMIALLVGVISLYPGVMADEYETAPPFIYAVAENPSSFDPLGAYDTTSGAVILNTLEGLYAFDYESESIEPIPRIAEDMGTWDAEKKVLTIPLRDDVTFWDGTNLTASDVVWNFERINALSTPDEDGAYLNEHGSLWINADKEPILESIEAIDDYTVEMTLGEFTTAWESLLPFWGAALLKPFDGGMEDTLTLEDMDKVIGTGPFMLSDYVAGETTTVVRYDEYYRGAADIEKIEFNVFADADAATQALMAKEIHVIRSLSETELENAEADPGIFVELLKGDCVYFYHMHVDNTPWEVRKALQFAFNYSYVPTLAMTLPSHQHPIPENMAGYNPDLPGLPYFDLEKAQAYMLDSEDPEIQANIALNELDQTSVLDDWIDAAQGDNPLYTANFTHYGTSFYTFLDNFAQYVGIELVDDTVGDWPTFLAYTSDADNVAQMQFSMGGWCPDYYQAVNMLQPLFGSGGSSNWNGLDNTTIDANLESLHTLTGEEQLEMVDTVVTQIIVEQAAAMYTVGAADLIAWNTDPDTGILGGADGLLNGRGDKYFYPIDFALESRGGIPGFDLGIVFIGLLGVSAFLVLKNRK